MTEEKKLKHIVWFVAGLLLIALIICSVYVLESKDSGKSSAPAKNSETGITNWIDAVNQRNIDRLYDLAPDEIKQQRTLAQFKEDNLNNTFFQPGTSFVNYSVIHKEQNGTYAQIIAQVFLHQPGNSRNIHGGDVPLQYKFALYFQQGEWKIWTLPWT